MQLIIILSAIVPLILGLLLGMLRGSRRATLRIILVILCLVLAFCLKGVVTKKIMQTEMRDGKTLEQLIISSLPENYAALGEALTTIITLIVTAVMFLLLFFGIKFISWLIIYPICKIFVKKARKKKDGTYGKKHALIGGFIGLIQGALVAVVLCVMLNGLFYNVSNISSSLKELSDTASGNASNASVMINASADEDIVIADETQNEEKSDSENNADKANNSNSESNADDGSGSGSLGKLGSFFDKIVNYKDTKTCEFVSKMGGNKLFNTVARIKTDDGKKLTLTGQLDGLNALIKIGKELAGIPKLVSKDFSTSSKDIVDLFNELDNITKDLSDESKEAVNTIVQAAADALLPDNINLDVSKLNLANVNYKNEGQIFEQLSAYKDIDFTEMTEEKFEKEAKNVVDLVMESDIVLPVISQSADFKLGLENEHFDFVESYITDLEKEAGNNEDKLNKVDMLKSFFGLKNGGESPEYPAS